MSEVRDIVRKEIWSQLAELNLRLKIFGQLFEASAENIDLLDYCAPTFFSICVDSMKESIALRVRKLTDRESSGPGRSHQNASLPRLLKELKAEYPDAATEIESILSNLSIQIEPIRTFVDKTVAHSDLQTLTTPLQFKLTSSDIRDATTALNELMNKISDVIGEPTTIFDSPLLLNDGEDLLDLLREWRSGRERQTRGNEKFYHSSSDLLEAAIADIYQVPKERVANLRYFASGKEPILSIIYEIYGLAEEEVAYIQGRTDTCK